MYTFKRNRVCPRCGHRINPYFYKWDERGRVVHLDCEEERDIRVKEGVTVG